MTRTDFLEPLDRSHVRSASSVISICADLQWSRSYRLTCERLSKCIIKLIEKQLHHHVRLDSVLLLRAAQQVVAEEGFDDALDQTRARVDEIEGELALLFAADIDELIGLHRQNELTIKEPFRVVINRKGGKTVLDVLGLGGSFVPADEEKNDETDSSAEGSDEPRMV
jgi:hypothetical protein